MISTQLKGRLHVIRLFKGFSLYFSTPDSSGFARDLFFGRHAVRFDVIARPRDSFPFTCDFYT